MLLINYKFVFRLGISSLFYLICLSVYSCCIINPRDFSFNLEMSYSKPIIFFSKCIIWFYFSLFCDYNFVYFYSFEASLKSFWRSIFSFYKIIFFCYNCCCCSTFSSILFWDLSKVLQFKWYSKDMILRFTLNKSASFDFQISSSCFSYLFLLYNFINVYYILYVGFV